MSKATTYLIKFDEETNTILDKMYKKLGWGKREALLKSLNLIEDVVEKLDKNLELVISVRDAKDKSIIVEKTSSYDGLRTPV